MTTPRRLVRIIEDVPAATAARYHTHDNLGHSMDTLKVIENPHGGYLGVYHAGAGDGFAVHVAASTDLMTWTHRALLDQPASQPAIAALPDGGFLLVVEGGGSGRPAWLRFKYYAGLDRLLAADADRVFDAPHTLVPEGRWAEGTPNIYAAKLAGPDGPDRSVFDIGFHYYRDGDVDRQGRGRLVNFCDWSTERQPRIDAAIEACGVAGNIGDRDQLVWRGRVYNLQEGQLRKEDWGSWRVFLYDWSTGVAHPLRIRTHGGSVAFGNPTITRLTAPSGAPAVFLSMFLFNEGAAPGEGGELVYFTEFG